MIVGRTEELRSSPRHGFGDLQEHDFTSRIRTALEATCDRIISQVVARGLRIAGAGVVLGPLIAALVAPRIQGRLFGTSAPDTITFAPVAGTLLLVALLASMVPARTASRVDTVIAMQAD